MAGSQVFSGKQIMGMYASESMKFEYGAKESPLLSL